MAIPAEYKRAGRHKLVDIGITFSTIKYVREPKLGLCPAIRLRLYRVTVGIVFFHGFGVGDGLAIGNAFMLE
ncbi:hypothetical protein C8J40_1195 [Sphingomonas sp. PP-CC-3A-396]|nr:hypothetical protein C8J40_1195 [Sphingomonas sp. PP-CC-3A-396]